MSWCTRTAPRPKMKKPVPMECDETQGFFNSGSQTGYSKGSGSGAAEGETPGAPEAEAAEPAGVTGKEAAAGAETAGAAAPETASEAAAEGEAEAAAAPEAEAAAAPETPVLDKRSENRKARHDEQYHQQLDKDGLYQMESFTMLGTGGGHITLDNDAIDKVMANKEQNLSKEEYDRMGDSACVDFFACCSAPNDCRTFGTAGFMDVLYYAQSGDIILFDNKCNLGTCLISCFTRSDWDHVGIVIRKPGGKRSDVYILEALAPTVCMDPLAKVMEWVIEDDGEGVMYWRPIQHPKIEGNPESEDSTKYPYGKITPEKEQELWDLALNYKGKPYQTDAGAMVDKIFYQDAACWNGIFGSCCTDREGQYDEVKEDKNSEEVFCSELAAHALIKVDIIKKRELSEMYMPKDLSWDPHSRTGNSQNGREGWMEGYQAGPEIKIMRMMDDDLLVDLGAQRSASNDRKTTNLV